MLLDNEKLSHWVFGSILSWLIGYWLLGILLLNVFFGLPTAFVNTLFFSVGIVQVAFTPLFYKLRARNGHDDFRAQRLQLVTLRLLPSLGLALSIFGLADHAFSWLPAIALFATFVAISLLAKILFV